MKGPAKHSIASGSPQNLAEVPSRPGADVEGERVIGRRLGGRGVDDRRGQRREMARGLRLDPGRDHRRVIARGAPDRSTQERDVALAGEIVVMTVGAGKAARHR